MTRIIAFCLLLSALSCYAEKPLRAIGARDSSGLPSGEYRVVNTRGDTQAKGTFKAGQMEGLWVFYDSRGTRTAEVRYHRGDAVGQYRFYFSAFAFPQAAGHLNTNGHLEGGKIVGEHIGYGPDGSLISRAVFNAGGEIKPSVGTPDLARRLADADYRLIEGLKKSVQDSL
jgi:hypothetical protein